MENVTVGCGAGGTIRRSGGRRATIDLVVEYGHVTILSATWPRRRPWRTGRYGYGVGYGGALRHVHGDATVELSTFDDADTGGLDVALEAGGVLDLHRFLGVQIALDSTLHHDRLRADVRLHDTFATDGNALRMRDRAFDLSADQQLFVGVQLALEAQGRTQH